MFLFRRIYRESIWTPLGIWFSWAVLQTLVVLVLLGVLTALLWVPGIQAKDFVGPFLLISLPFGLGWAQGWILRERSFQPGMWMLIQAAGWPLSYLVFFLLLRLLPDGVLEWFAPWGGLSFTGLVTGIWQYLFLRKRFHWAVVWIPAAALGWGALGWLTGEQFVDIWDFLGIGLVPALFSGAALAWLWNRTIT